MENKKKNKNEEKKDVEMGEGEKKKKDSDHEKEGDEDEDKHIENNEDADAKETESIDLENLITRAMKAKQKLKKMKKIKKKKKTKFTKFMHLIFGFFYLMIQCAFGITIFCFFLYIGIAFMNTESKRHIPQDDNFFGFCDIVDNTLTYFMNTDDTSVRMLGAICNNKNGFNINPYLKKDKTHLKICLYGEYIEDRNVMEQPCDVLKYTGNFGKMTFKSFEKDSEAIAEIAKTKQIVKTTIFVSTHANKRSFGIDTEHKLKASDFFDKIKSIVGKTSELIIFDSSCLSFEHPAQFLPDSESNFFSKTAIYVGGACPMSKHSKTTTPKQNNLVYDNLMEPILHNYEYTFRRTHQTFDEFKNSILSVKTFQDLEEKITPIECAKRKGVQQKCVHFKTQILQKPDLPIQDWFGFLAPAPNFFLQFQGFTFQHGDVTIWGFRFKCETQNMKGILSTSFEPTITKINDFEVLDITTWLVSKNYPKDSESKFYEHTVVLKRSGTTFSFVENPINLTESKKEFPKIRYFFSSRIDTTFSKTWINENLQDTHLFRYPLSPILKFD